MKKHSIVLISCALLVVLFAAGGYLYKRHQVKKYGFMAENNASTFVRDYSQTLGSDDARVYLVEFSDPACETCAAFHPFVKQLMADNPGKIKLVMRYAPFHEGADVVVKILEAARKQGKFWETLEMMYGTQRYWASHHNPQPHILWRYLPNLGLDMEQLKNDLADPEIARRIQQDMEDVNALNVRKTPGFFVNGKPLEPFGRRQLKALVESEIRARY